MFINKDPIEEAGGINLYGFCRNNSINAYDILGHTETETEEQKRARLAQEQEERERKQRQRDDENAIWGSSPAERMGADASAWFRNQDIRKQQASGSASGGSGSSAGNSGSNRGGSGPKEGATQEGGNGTDKWTMTWHNNGYAGPAWYNDALEPANSTPDSTSRLTRFNDRLFSGAGLGQLYNNVVSSVHSALDPYMPTWVGGVGGALNTAMNASRGVGFGPSMGMLQAEGGMIDAGLVRFTQNSIRNTFSDGSYMTDLVAGLRSGAISPESIPPIRLFQQDGNWFSLDNRRLWSFQQAEVQVPYRLATPSEIAAQSWKFTTTNNGTSIIVRGGN